MSSITSFKDKDPKELARLLSAVSSSLLPNPGIDEVIIQTSKDADLVRTVLTEIRTRLRVPEGDNSVDAQSRIYAFLSQEISKASLADVDLSRLKSRLANKGELHPSQYEVRFSDHFAILETLGIRKSHVTEAITHPDEVIHIKAKHLSEDRDPRLTISIKSVPNKRAEDSFILLVVSTRKGQVQEAIGAFRVYFSDVDLTNVSGPIDVIRAFVNTYGLTFSLGNSVSKFLYNEAIEVHQFLPQQMFKYMKPVEGQAGTLYIKFLVGGDMQLHGTDATVFAEVILGFMVNLTRYFTTLRKHNVNLAPEAESRFPRI